jgi:hypothetical protein
MGPQAPQYPARSTIPHDIARPPSRWHSDALVRPSHASCKVSRPSRLCKLGLARDYRKGYDLAGPCNHLVRYNCIVTPVVVPTPRGIAGMASFKAFGRFRMMIYVTRYQIQRWITLAAYERWLLRSSRCPPRAPQVERACPVRVAYAWGVRYSAATERVSAPPDVM